MITADSLTDKILEFQEKMAQTKKDNEDDEVCLWPPPELAPTTREEMQDGGVQECILPRYPTPDHEEYASYRAMAYLLRKLLRLVYQRITALSQQLEFPAESPVVYQIWATFRHLMRHHIDLLFDRHVDHWILCCIYAVCRTVQYEPEVKFAKIIEAYVAVREPDLGSVTCQRIVRHIKLAAGKTTEEGMGNVITLYNKVFVPAMKDHLLHSPSLKSCAAYLARIKSGADPDTAMVSDSEDVVTAPLSSNSRSSGLLVYVHSSTCLDNDLTLGGAAAAHLEFGRGNQEAVALANMFAAEEHEGAIEMV
jgi:Retinoblastoma-associated protein B domain